MLASAPAKRARSSVLLHTAPLLRSVYFDNESLELYHGRLDKRPGAIALRIRCANAHILGEHAGISLKRRGVQPPGATPCHRCVSAAPMVLKRILLTWHACLGSAAAGMDLATPSCASSSARRTASRGRVGGPCYCGCKEACRSMVARDWQAPLELPNPVRF